MHSAAAALTLLATSAVAQTPSLTIIEPAPGRNSSSFIDSSRSSRSLALFSSASGLDVVAARWSPQGGRQDESAIPSTSFAYGVSSNGNTLVGYAANASRNVFLHDSAGYREIGLPAGRSFETQGVFASAWAGDGGSWAIANFRGTGDSRTPYRWTQATGWRSLGGPLLVTRTSDVTPDGSVMVGETLDFNTGGGFIYREGQGYTLTNTFLPRAVNDPGTIFAGSRVSGNGDGIQVAEMLTPTGVVSLGSFPGYGSTVARDVSNDGSIAVGIMSFSTTLQPRGFVWTPTSGLRSLEDYLTDFNLALPANTGVTDIAITGDGSMISGQFSNPTGTRVFAVIIPAPSIIMPLCVASMVCTRRRR